MEPRWIRLLKLLLTHHANILKYTTDQPEGCALPTHELRFFFARSHMEQRAQHDFLGASNPIRGRFLKAVSDY